MRAGPKRQVTAEPLDLEHLPAQRGHRAVRFIEQYLKVPKGKGARRPVKLRSWQRDIVRRVLAPGVRQGLVSVPRGNGKTALAGMLACYGLFADGVEGAQVLTVASDERQARQAWNAARRMIELEPELAERVQVFQDRIYAPHTDSLLAPLPAEPATLQGWDPSLAIIDELHVVRDETYEAMLLASGKRERSLLLSISTAPGDADSVMHRLTEHGRAGEDPSFAFVEYAAPSGCRVDDEDAWEQANPALDDFLHRDAIRSSLATSRESSFRRYRLNQLAGVEDAWVDRDLWESCVDPDRDVADGERVVLAFDGSASGDSTVLIGSTVEPMPHVFLVGLWENPDDGRWRVPRAEVDEAVDAAFDRFDVVELACDPWGWRSEIEAWAQRHGERRVIEWPTNVRKRMAPATDRAYQAIAQQQLTHSGDRRLSAHVTNAVAKSTPMGDLLAKERKQTPRKIDAAVAMVVAVDRAAFHVQNRKRRRMTVV